MLSPPESGEIQPDPNALTTGDATPRFPRVTINVRLIAIVLTIAVPLNLVVAAVIWRLASASNETQRASLLYSARSVAAAVDAELGKYIALAQVMSHSPALLEESIDVFETQLRQGLSSEPDVWALVADINGKQLVNTAVPQGQPLRSPNRTKEGIAAQNRAFEIRSVFVSDVFVGPDQKWAATANIPIFKNGEPFRALAITVHTRRFLDLVAFQEMPKDWIVGIRDTQGRLVVRLPDHESRVGQLASEQVRQLMKQDGLFDLVTIAGDQFILANAHSNVSGWTTGIGAKTAELRTVVLGAVGSAIALGGIISLLSLVFALWMARRITRPLAELRGKASALMKDPQVPFESGVPELCELWATLKRASANRFRSDALLRKSEKRLSQIINTYNGYVGLLDKGGRITEANVQMLQAIGAPREAVIGQPFAVAPCWANSPMPELIARGLAGETIRRDLQYFACGGEIRWIDFQVTPLRTADGMIDGVVPSGYDITDRKRVEDALRRSEARFRNLYEHAFAGMTLSDWDGRLQHCNTAYCTLVGYSEDELRGQHFSALIHPDDRDDNISRGRGLRDGEVNAIEIESRYVHKSGKTVWVRKTISTLPDETGKPSGFIALAMDISVRKQQEELLRRSEARFRNLYEHALAGIAVSDWDGRLQQCNPAFCALVGYSEQELRGMHFSSLIHPDDRDPNSDSGLRAREVNAIEIENRYVHKNGQPVWVRKIISTLPDETGNPSQFFALAVDVSERKRAEDALRRSEARFRNLYEHALAGITLCDWEGRFQHCNPAFCALVGYSENELRGMHFGALIHPDDRNDNVDNVRRLRDGETNSFVMENRYVHKNGRPAWVRKIIATLPDEAGRPSQFFALAIDISERKQQEELLRESEARLQLALDAGGAAMWESSLDGGEFIASDRALTLHGLPPRTPMTQDKALATVHPEDRPKVEQALRDTLERGAPFHVEYRFQHPDGSVRWLDSQAQLRQRGRERRLIGLVHDISERKAAEAAIRTSRMRLQLALDAARLGWWLYDPVQGAASWDERFKAIFDIVDPQADVAGIIARVPPEDASRVCAAAAAALNPADPKPFVGEYRIQRTNGEIRWIEVYGIATFEGAGEARRAIIMVGTAADVTERKRAEERQLLLMRELNHRTKNLLSVVQSIANQTAASNPTDFAERFSQRIQALSANQDLLVRSEWRGIDIQDLVRAQLAHFADLIGERIVIEGPHLRVTPWAAQSIGMALHELATNAGKYGSLSDDHGGVTIDWRLENGQFSIGWIEHDGPRVRPPDRRGFGSTIISAVAEAGVGGEVKLDYASTGVVWRLKCAASKALSAGA
jgi:PAS domain S-box-containing protein